MARLVAVDYAAGKALFDVDNDAVIVDINNHDVDSVTTHETALTASAWLKVGPELEYPDVWRELAEAATTSLEIKEKNLSSTERRFRVPANVRDQAKEALTWVNSFERGKSTLGMKIAESLATDAYIPTSRVIRIARYFSRRPESITQNAGWSDDTEGFPSDERIRYSLWGGDAAKSWTNKIVLKHNLLSAPVDTMPTDDETYLPDAETGDDEPFSPDADHDYFGIGVDPDTTQVTGMCSLASDGTTWNMRQGGYWTEMKAPSPDTVLILLDDDTAKKLADILDNGSEQLPYELSMINPHEAALAAAAYPEIDWELIDRVFDIYDSQERSINAEKQPRGAGGRFGSSPDTPPAQAAQEQNKTPVAHLPQQMNLVPDVQARISEYLQQVAAQRGQAQAPTGAPENNGPMFAVHEFSPGDPVQAQGTGSGNVTDVRPLYLAIVDDIDTTAVLDVVALVPPAAGQQGDVTCWKRDNGKWIPAQDILAELRGVTPPPVVEITDDQMLANVLTQVDQSTNGQAAQDQQPAQQPADQTKPAGPPGQTEVNPDGSSGPKPDANPDQQRRAASSMDEFGGYSSDKRDKLAKKGMALPDGSYPIETVADLKNAIQAFGRAKNKSLTKSHIIKRARALHRTDLIPESWGKQNSADTYEMWGPNGEIMSLIAVGGKEISPSDVKNTERLRQYWVHGEGAAKIGWGTPNDWYRCVSHLSKYLGVRAKGYCTLRHKEATGFWPGHEPTAGGDGH